MTGRAGSETPAGTALKPTISVSLGNELPRNIVHGASLTSVSYKTERKNDLARMPELTGFCVCV